MKYIRDHYKVPAKRGGKVRILDPRVPNTKSKVEARIVAAAGGYLRVSIFDEGYRYTIHPTWEVEYL